MDYPYYPNASRQHPPPSFVNQSNAPPQGSFPVGPGYPMDGPGYGPPGGHEGFAGGPIAPTSRYNEPGMGIGGGAPSIS